MTRRTPFDVEPQEIELLGSGFAAFVNSLLSAESARAHLKGEQLRTGSRDNVADGGVDAHLVSSTPTRWLPGGDTAWQFKSGDLGPTKCKTELRGAAWAKTLIKHGASYRLVLGAALGSEKIGRRRKALIEVAQEEGLLGPGQEDRIAVLDADHLARWASEFPSISQTPVLRGITPQVMPFDLWSDSRRHQTSWVGHESRDNLVDEIRRALVGGEYLDVRIAGPSGIGKTRLVMETLRRDDLLPLVAYVDDAEGLDGSLMGMLATRGHDAILVVDECSPKRHEQLAARLLKGSPLRLVTIGEHREERGYPLRCPVWVVPGLPAQALDEYLKANHTGLSPEARRLVAEHVGGNVRYAAVLAERVLNADGRTVVELMRSGDLTELLALEVPEGDGFFFSQALALPERFGFEGGLEHQLRAVAEFAGTSEERLRTVVNQLEERGLIEAHGRYRSVAPDPLATYLAAQAWQTWGARIVEDFLPEIESGMRTSILRRAASLGRYGPVRAQFVGLLEDPDLFGSLRSIEEGDTSEVLLHLAVIAPAETVEHIAAAVQQASVAELRSMKRSRRNLVWALERLAWHSATFETAAEVLLKLALAENESFANNATGVWVTLFGTMLPATAADPVLRLRHLQDQLASENPDVRALLVRAAAAGMDSHESVVVSGELQGGTVVEPRGMPATWGEAADYRVALAEMLRELCDDPVSEIAEAALDSLVRTIHPFADDPLVWPRLKPILLSLVPPGLRAARREAEGLIRLYERVRGEDDEYRRPELVSALVDLLDELPQPTDDERLESLAARDPWDLSDDGTALADLMDAVVSKIQSDGLLALIEWTVEHQPPSAWYIGGAVAEAPDVEIEAVISELTAQLPSSELMLAGYLAAVDENSDAPVFDEFLDQGLGADIDSEVRLRLTVRGPVTSAATGRIIRIAESSSVLPAARVLMPWTGRLAEETSLRLLHTWIERISSQEDYNALVDWANLWCRRHEVSDAAVAVVAKLIFLRRDYPEVGQEGWDWSQLASKVVMVDAAAVAELLLELVSTDNLMLAHHEEERVFHDAAKRQPAAVWSLVADRLVAGDWRVALSLRGSFLHAIPLEIIKQWVGKSAPRAAIIADIAPVGGNSPSPYADFLLTEFGESERVAGALAGELSSGTWVGPWSNRIRGQIEQMDAWLEHPNHSTGVKNWARQMKASLERQLEEALQHEAEELF